MDYSCRQTVGGRNFGRYGPFLGTLKQGASHVKHDRTRFNTIAGVNIAPGQQSVRLQGGGLRFLDAHEIPQRDFNVVTRPLQSNNTQHWRLTKVGGNVHTIVQVSSGRFLDAHEIASLNFRVVTRPQQNNDTQRWRLFDFGGGFFTIQQVSSGRFLEATLDGDFQVVTRPHLAVTSKPGGAATRKQVTSRFRSVLLLPQAVTAQLDVEEQRHHPEVQRLPRLTRRHLRWTQLPRADDGQLLRVASAAGVLRVGDPVARVDLAVAHSLSGQRQLRARSSAIGRYWGRGSRTPATGGRGTPGLLCNPAVW